MNMQLTNPNLSITNQWSWRVVTGGLYVNALLNRCRSGPQLTSTLSIQKKMRRYTNLILILAVLFTLIILLYAGDPSSLDGWNGMPRFFGWACLPYGILLFFNNIWSGVFKKDLSLLITTSVVSSFAVLMVVDAFFIHPDAQSGLIFLFLPGYQAIAAILGGLIGFGLHQKS